VSLNQAKALRNKMTEAERRLWYWLRAHRLADHKFKRQVPIDSYIVDFACLGRNSSSKSTAVSMRRVSATRGVMMAENAGLCGVEILE
jgi:very-short-patch-repair endonuclease